MLFLHDSYLYSSDSAVMDYQVLGQQDGTGCMVVFNSLLTYSLESYQWSIIDNTKMYGQSIIRIGGRELVSE